MKTEAENCECIVLVPNEYTNPAQGRIRASRVRYRVSGYKDTLTHYIELMLTENKIPHEILNYIVNYA